MCENYSNIYNARSRRFASGELIIRVLPPIPTAGRSSASEDIAKLSDQARDAMLDALGELAARTGSASASTIVERDGQKALGAHAASRTSGLTDRRDVQGQAEDVVIAPAQL